MNQALRLALLAALLTTEPSPGAQPGRILDLSTVGTPSNAVTRIHGSVGDGRFGVPVAGGLDCDGDAFADAAFASMLASPLGRTRAGELALVFGHGAIGGTVNSSGFAPGILKIAGDAPYETTGAEIWIDDVTGDGIGDVLICRQNYTPMVGREGAGALTILVGGPELRTQAETLQYLDLRNPPSSVRLTTFWGRNAYDRLGIWVRTGDLTGDGIADIVVAADEADADGQNNRGEVYVIRGGAHLATNQVIDLAQFGSTPLKGHLARILPPPGSANYHLGATCQMADLDNNGRAEVLFAAALNRAGASLRLPGAPAGTGQAIGGASRGKLFIAWDDNFPEGAWPAGYTFVITASPGGRTEITGRLANYSFGEEILGGLDYDGDGLAELFVGDLAANEGNGGNSGAGYVFYQASGLKNRTFDMASTPADIAYTLIKGPRSGSISSDTVAQGDFDGDGFGDLAIGNPHDYAAGRVSAGTMHVLYGQTGRWPGVINLALGNLPDESLIRIARIDGAKGSAAGDTGDTLCYSAAAGDLDQDGLTDLIVNEMVGNGLDPGTIDVGNMIWVSGASLFGPPPVIQSLQVINQTNLLLRFSTKTNSTYSIERSESLTPPDWSTLLNGVPGVRGVIETEIPGAATSPSGYIRVGVE